MQTKNLQHFTVFHSALVPLITPNPRLIGTPLAHRQFDDFCSRSLEYPNPPKGKPRVQQGSSEKRERQFHCNAAAGCVNRSVVEILSTHGATPCAEYAAGDR